MAKCCANCFSDRLIIDYINKENDEIGDCKYCGTKQTKIVNTGSFTDVFESLIELYTESSETFALPLNILVQQDWEVFKNIGIANNLFPDIVNGLYSGTYTHKNINEKSVRGYWDSFKHEVKHNNRFFPKSDQLDLSDLRAWLQELEAEKYTKITYRARISNSKNAISIDKMGRPPMDEATAGRANPIGISYLYLATNDKTAIAEVRPHKGDVVTIVKVKIPKNLRLADLRNPKKYLSPFTRPDEEAEQLFKYIALLQHLGEELSKPILPREAHLEYLPSQYLAELIKDSGFDGIIFKSSVGNGDNYALFRDDGVEYLETKLQKIDNLVFKFSQSQ